MNIMQGYTRRVAKNFHRLTNTEILEMNVGRALHCPNDHFSHVERAKVYGRQESIAMNRQSFVNWFKRSN